MRTTVDIPDALFREIKSKAAIRGETLKMFLLRSLKAELEAEKGSAGKRIRLPIVKSKEATYDLDPDRLAKILDEEDREMVAGH